MQACEPSLGTVITTPLYRQETESTDGTQGWGWGLR